MPVEDLILHPNTHLPIYMLLLAYVSLFEKVTTESKFLRRIPYTMSQVLLL